MPRLLLCRLVYRAGDIIMNLFNTNIVPEGLRHCYWEAEYIASQPFCTTSKLTEKESFQMLEFEEIKFWERNEQLKKQLQNESRQEIDDQNECEASLVVNVDCQKAVELYMNSSKKFYFAGFAKRAKGFGFYNIQTSGRVLPKSKQEKQQIRLSFLTR